MKENFSSQTFASHQARIMYSSGKSLVEGMTALEFLASLFCVHPYKNDLVATAPVLTLDEGTLLKIFSFLPLRDLLRACQVCRLWYRLSFDMLLWKTLDLRCFSKSLDDPKKFQELVSNRLGKSIICLDLSGFVMTEGSLRALATQCKKLRVLKLRSVTFAQTCKEMRSKETVLFPKHLECLDIRFSHGNPRVYRAIEKELSKVKWLGLCDAFFQILLADERLETAINSMKCLRKLDVSHCRTLKDSTLTLFARCRELEVLSVRKCSFLTGAFVEVFLDSCVELKTLILDGISLDDETLQNVGWRYSSLKHLDLGWCRLITPAGLKSALPQIARIQTLEYLGLCAIGAEKAVTDHILLELGVSLSWCRSKKLKSLNVSRSQALTQAGVDDFWRSCSLVEMLDTTDCLAIKQCLSQVNKECENYEGDVKVFGKNTNKITFSRTEGRGKGSISATQFARSKYILETPL